MFVLLGWEDFKDWLSATLHLTHWNLHVIVGLVLLVVFGRLLRRPLSSFVPLLPIALLEAINEAFDFTRYYVAGWPWQGRSTGIEVLLTLGPPLAVVLCARAVARGRVRSA